VKFVAEVNCDGLLNETTELDPLKLAALQINPG